MVNCASCGKKIGVFQKKYDYYDEDDNLIKYCEECDKKATLEAKKIKEKDREKLLSNLKNDKLINKFSEKNLPICLTLVVDEFNSLDEFRIALKRSDNIGRGINEDESIDYYKFISFLCSNKIFEFIKMLEVVNDYGIEEDTVSLLSDDDNCTIRVDYREWPATQTFKWILGCYNGSEEEMKNSLIFIQAIISLFKQSEQNNYFHKFLEIIYTKYGEFDVRILFSVLYDIAKQDTINYIFSIISELKTKDNIFDFILESNETFVIEEMSLWYEEYMTIVLACLIKKGLVNCKNLYDFRKDLLEYQGNKDLKRFERKLLSSENETTTIGDVDLMTGFEFEYFLGKLFSNMGYKVKQTKLSGDQGADLVIERNGVKTVIQAKRYTGKVSNKAIQEVVASIKHYKASSGMIVTNSYFTSSAVKLANSNEVRLVDRDKLKDLINTYLNNF